MIWFRQTHRGIVSAGLQAIARPPMTQSAPPQNLTKKGPS
jgi:hypothetical protein